MGGVICKYAGQLILHRENKHGFEVFPCLVIGEIAAQAEGCDAGAEYEYAEGDYADERWKDAQDTVAAERENAVVVIVARGHEIAADDEENRHAKWSERFKRKVGWQPVGVVVVEHVAMAVPDHGRGDEAYAVEIVAMGGAHALQYQADADESMIARRVCLHYARDMNDPLNLLTELIVSARKAGATAADALLYASSSLSVSRRMRNPEGLERSESSGVSLRVFVGE